MELRGVAREEVVAPTEHDEGVVQGRTGRRAHEAYDATGRTIAIELLDVSEGVVFDGLPETGLVRGVVERLAADQGWSGRT